MVLEYRNRVAASVQGGSPLGAITRVRLIYGVMLILVMLFGIRLFYVQVIRYGYYKNAALSDQRKQYEIPAARGIIEAHDGNKIVSIVLNQKLYTLYADPTFIKNPDDVSTKIVSVIGGQADKYARLMRTPHTRYAILAKQLGGDQNKRLLALKIPGLGTQAQDYRTYPQGTLAAQLLGFVDSNGTGQYGLEQAFDKQLKGTPGQVKAVTDVNGVPLAATQGNVQTAPVNGDSIVTSLDLSMQAQMEQIIASEYKKTKSHKLSAIIMNPNTGQIKAMANYPTYDPANYQKAGDASVFQNAAATDAIEPGSTMKVLTAAAALDAGAVTPSSSYYDPAHWNIDGFTIKNIEQDGGARQQNVASILALSLNTGATWLLMQMSQAGGTTINGKGIDVWRNYLVHNYRFGQTTNIEQGYESPGVVPPRNAYAPELTYANTAFGQGIQTTALQMAAALSSVVDGGTYYQPTLVDQIVHADGTIATNKPTVVATHVVKGSTASAMLPFMENVVNSYRDGGYRYMTFPANYIVGGKTGTAQIANPNGGYYDNKFNGTYYGFVGGDKPQYVIAVYNIDPSVAGYAGSMAAQPVFADLAHMLINNSFVTPKTH